MDDEEDQTMIMVSNTDLSNQLGTATQQVSYPPPTPSTSYKKKPV
jgi:hypothetical protein